MNENTPRNHFGTRLQAALAFHGEDTKWLSSVTGIPRGTLNKYLCNDKCPTNGNGWELAVGLGTTSAWMESGCSTLVYYSGVIASFNNDQYDMVKAIKHLMGLKGANVKNVSNLSVHLVNRMMDKSEYSFETLKRYLDAVDIPMGEVIAAQPNMTPLSDKEIYLYSALMEKKGNTYVCRLTGKSYWVCMDDGGSYKVCGKQLRKMRKEGLFTASTMVVKNRK